MRESLHCSAQVRKSGRLDRNGILASAVGPCERQVASELRRFKLINSHIEDGSRNFLPLTALRQYDLCFWAVFVYFLRVATAYTATALLYRPSFLPCLSVSDR